MPPALNPRAPRAALALLLGCAPADPRAAPEPACPEGEARCGACAPACPEGARCEAGRCTCAPGRDLCDGACVDPRTDPHHCGACGRACRGGERCEGAVCGPACSTGEARCGAECVSVYVDPRHCGGCDRACGRNEACRSGACACAAGYTWCPAAAACVDTATDGRHCGGCNNACPPATVCAASRCGAPCAGGGCGPDGPADRCADALPAVWRELTGAPLDVAGVAAVTVDTRRAPRDPSPVEGCGAWGSPTARVRLALDAPAVVYADSLSAGWDTRLALLGEDCRTVARAERGDVCNDDACGGARSQLAAVLPAGVWFVALGGRGDASGVATLRLQRLRAPSGAAVHAPAPTARYVGTTAGLGGAVTSRCGGVGPEDLFWWTSCGASSSTSLEASTCDGAGWSTALWYVGPSVQACALDAEGCGARSRLRLRVPAEAGLHGLYLDGFNDGRGAVAGPYALDLTHP